MHVVIILKADLMLSSIEGATVWPQTVICRDWFLCIAISF